jgi:histidinol-phosphate phosphatase family protein
MSKALFLDRDGVINERLPAAYVQRPDQFIFTEGSLEAIAKLSDRFDRIFIVTNQQGIGKGLMTEEDLEEIHRIMLEKIRAEGGRIDAVYYCPALVADHSIDRKPNPGMALRAKTDYPDIDFKQSVVVGDSISDMLFGKRLGMKTVLVRANPKQAEQASIITVDTMVDSLLEWVAHDPN